jgi:hypothetical protein
VAYSKLIGLRFGLWRFLYDLIATKFDNGFTATQFSNAVFGIAVDDSTNRSKGASGRFDWLPPNDAYQCQYVLRFWRVSSK